MCLTQDHVKIHFVFSVYQRNQVHWHVNMKNNLLAKRCRSEFCSMSVAAPGMYIFSTQLGPKYAHVGKTALQIDIQTPTREGK